MQTTVNFANGFSWLFPDWKMKKNWGLAVRLSRKVLRGFCPNTLAN
jgi:hypothetical protein